MTSCLKDFWVPLNFKAVITFCNDYTFINEWQMFYVVFVLSAKIQCFEINHEAIQQ